MVENVAESRTFRKNWQRMKIKAEALRAREQKAFRGQVEQLFDFAQRKGQGQSIVTRRYLLLSTPRTGSTLLSRQITRLEGLGSVHEWFNWDLMRHVCARMGLKTMMFSKYLAFLDKAASSADGIYGVNLHVHQYQNMLAKGFDVLKKVPFERIYWIERRDKIRQAYSWAKAQKTLCWSGEAERELGFESGMFVKITASEVAKVLADVCSLNESFMNTVKSVYPISGTFIFEDIVKNHGISEVNQISEDFKQGEISSAVLPKPTSIKQSQQADEEQLNHIKKVFGIDPLPTADTIQ